MTISSFGEMFVLHGSPEMENPISNQRFQKNGLISTSMRTCWIMILGSFEDVNG